MNYSLVSYLKSIYAKSPSFVKKMVDDYRYKKLLGKAFDTFLSDAEKGNSQLIAERKKDIYTCREKYLTTPQEYFLFGFREQTSDEYRDSFISDQFRNKVLIDIVGVDVFLNDLRNKFNFYQLTKPYFRRGVFLFKKDCKFEEFCDFAIKNNNLFLKRNSSSKGRGILVKDVPNEKVAKEVYDQLIKEGGDWIIEERIRQAPQMALWNDSSVNTVRLPSILNNGVFSVIGPVFRTGRKGSIVDNAAAGGLIACIDAKTGIIDSDGVDEKGHYYECHPNSNIRFNGWQIPQWKELLALAEEIQRTIPHHKYVGWDFALTEKGWVVIEGNWGQFLSQYNNHIGLKKQFISLLGYEF